MTRFILSAVFTAATFLVAAAGAALAEPASTKQDPGRTGQIEPGQRITIPMPPSAFTPRPAVISQTLYMERCQGGCTVRKGDINDARQGLSPIPTAGAGCPDPTGAGCTLSEYKNGAGETGAAADAEWDLLMQCMREVYSPYDVNITDVKPAAGISYHMAIVAGTPQQIGRDGSTLGVAPISNDCSPSDNVISFSFANAHRQTETVSRVWNLCWTAAQESAHAFGLDHSYEYQDMRSACNDPMTYREDCGGQKFFRNEVAKCGEDFSRACKCGANQNSHLKILAVFGPGQSIIPAPTVSITSPAASSQAANSLAATVQAMSFSQRGVAKVELILNGYKWAETKGAPFGFQGQPESTYTLNVPNDIPNSVYDVVVRSYDDLGTSTDSTPVTVTKGPAGGCTSADACLKGQKCEAGKCFWEPATGELGATCEYNQFCISGLCTGTVDQQICTQPCSVSVEATCPEDSGLECIDTGGGQGVCFPYEESGDCCSANRGSSPYTFAIFGVFVLGFVMRPRRSRK